MSSFINRGNYSVEGCRARPQVSCSFGKCLDRNLGWSLTQAPLCWTFCLAASPTFSTDQAPTVVWHHIIRVMTRDKPREVWWFLLWKEGRGCPEAQSCCRTQLAREAAARVPASLGSRSPPPPMEEATPGPCRPRWPSFMSLSQTLQSLACSSSEACTPRKGNHCVWTKMTPSHVETLTEEIEMFTPACLPLSHLLFVCWKLRYPCFIGVF